MKQRKRTDLSKHVESIGKRLLFPPPWATFAVMLLGYGALIAAALWEACPPLFRYAAYFASACALTVTVTGMISFYRTFGGVRPFLLECVFSKNERLQTAAERYRSDARFRTDAALLCSFAVNFAFAAVKLLAGAVLQSAWFVLMAVYYALLAAMRLLLVRLPKDAGETARLRRCRLCGWGLLAMTPALGAIVGFIVWQNKGSSYPGTLIYVAALYAFYAIIAACTRLCRTRRDSDPVVRAANAISLVSAAVSILTLETAMLAQFGDGDAAFRQIMTAATGTAVCMITFAAALCLIRRANRRLRETNDTQIRRIHI